MSTFAIIGWIAACLGVTFWRSERRFRAGYLLALDHVEQLMLTRSGAHGLHEATTKLRAEMGVPGQSDGEKP